MSEHRARRRGGREARRQAAGGTSGVSRPYITRRIPCTEVLTEEGLETIEANAETILEEIGIEFRDDEECLALWREAGADVDGERVHIPRGLARKILETKRPVPSRSMRSQSRSATSRSAATIRSSLRFTARPSSATWTRAGATGPSRTSAIS